MTEHRIPDDPRADRGLWDIVAALPVPPTADDFMPRLAARLADEPGVAAPAGDAGGALPGTSVLARRRFPSRVFIAAATVAAAAAVFAFAILPALRGTETATAADMLASMNAAGGGVQVVRLHIVSGIVASPLYVAGAGYDRCAEPQAQVEDDDGLDAQHQRGLARK